MTGSDVSSEPAWLARALRPITEVRPGEAVTALLLTANVFLLLSAYDVIKPLREDLILAMGSGAEYKAYMSGAIALLLFALVPLYGKCSALSVYLAVDALGFSVPRFAWISIALAATWIGLALAIGRIYHGLDERQEKLGA